MSDLKLGELSDLNAVPRDAVHVAVVRAYAAKTLEPGQHVGVNAEDSDGPNFSPDARKKIGIVDPFLKRPVQQGDFCLVLLYPGTTQNLRHDWDHPDLERPEPASVDTYDDGCRGC